MNNDLNLHKKKSTSLLIGLFLVFMFEFISSQSVYGQSIRKNYREMTEMEKVNLVNAFYELRLGPDIVNDLANFHRDFFNLDEVGDGTSLDIHFNLPDEPERDIFLAWHRRQMFEMEQALQDINPHISVPFVDWTIDDSVESPVWDDNFMGQFDSDWNLQRNFGGLGLLPTAVDVQSIMEIESDFLIFSNSFERGAVHAGPHNWIGGAMGGGGSPRDPVFYLHHTFVDKVWQDWEKINEISIFERSDMLRYDGTYTFDGETIPSINPNDIVNSNSLGVFYAVDQLASLENYEISNNHRELEVFYYQFTIEVGNNFNILNNTNCKITSVNEIIFKPGFHAENGSNLIAEIDNELSAKYDLDKNAIIRNQIPFDVMEGDLINVYGMNENIVPAEKQISVFPNPFSNKITINNLEEGVTYLIEISDLLGSIIYNKKIKVSSATTEISEFDSISHGLYFIRVKIENRIILNTKLIKK